MAFSKAIEVDSSYTCAVANLGNLLYLKGQYEEALGMYQKALLILRNLNKEKSRLAFKIIINAGKVNKLLGREAECEKYYNLPLSIDPEKVKHFMGITQGPSGIARAAEVTGKVEEILFVEEEKKLKANK